MIPFTRYQWFSWWFQEQNKKEIILQIKQNDHILQILAIKRMMPHVW